MGPEQDQTPLSKQAQDLDYSSFEQEHRRRRIVLIAVAVALTIGCAAAFIGTIESIGSMSAHVPGLFEVTPSSK